MAAASFPGDSGVFRRPGGEFCQPCPTGPNPITKNELESRDCLRIGFHTDKIRFSPNLQAWAAPGIEEMTTSYPRWWVRNPRERSARRRGTPRLEG